MPTRDPVALFRLVSEASDGSVLSSMGLGTYSFCLHGRSCKKGNPEFNVDRRIIKYGIWEKMANLNLFLY